MANTPVIVGIDEAGRGALAGPVSAGACVIPEGITIPKNITDSKKLTHEKRLEALLWIEEHCIYGWSMVDAMFIDEHGILEATEKAMQQALEEVEKHITPTYILTDGRDKFWFNYPHSSVIKGDELEPCISAASIVAKVKRDQLMQELDAEYPDYGLAEHKGYGTDTHTKAIQSLGLSDIHRKSFCTKLTPHSSVES